MRPYSLSVARRVSLTMIGAIAIIALFGVSSKAGAEMTSAQILEKCRQTYRTMKSYSGTTNVITKRGVRGSETVYNTSATVEFVRPGKIRVDGTTMAPSKFCIVSDGQNTWQTSIVNPAKWDRGRSPAISIAAFNGVSQQASSVVPALLLDARSGNPFSTPVSNGVKREPLNGSQVYRIESSLQMGHVTFWIDVKTFRIVKLVQHSEVSKSGKGAAHLPPLVIDVTVTFTGEHLNSDIAGTTFAKPAGAP